MIEVDIPLIDPMQHKPKIFFGLTMRQCICVVPCAAVGALLFAATYDISSELAVASMMVGVAPAVCLGWIEPYNMKFEDYIKLFWFNTFISNPKRVLKTDDATVPSISFDNNSKTKNNFFVRMFKGSKTIAQVKNAEHKSDCEEGSLK